MRRSTAVGTNGACHLDAVGRRNLNVEFWYGDGVLVVHLSLNLHIALALLEANEPSFWITVST